MKPFSFKRGGLFRSPLLVLLFFCSLGNSGCEEKEVGSVTGDNTTNSSGQGVSASSHSVKLSESVYGAMFTLTRGGEILEIGEVNGDEITLENIYSHGSYTIAVEKEGFCIPPQEFTTNSENETVVEVEEIADNRYTYHWESNLKGKTFECSSNIPSDYQIEFLAERNEPDYAAYQILKDKHHILLSNEDVHWTYEYVSRLLKIVASIPFSISGNATFILTDRNLPNDIEIAEAEGVKKVYLNTEAFNNVSPRMVLLDGVRGRYFSHRLFHALIRFYTKGGFDRRAVETILNRKFGVTLDVKNIQELTGEDPGSFQDFKDEEVLDLITSFAEMPQGMYKISGLRYLIRRLDGHPHPLYPDAPAVAWPRGPNEDSYIEFMEKAFKGASEEAIHRLIIHEKSHFLWRNLFSEELRQAWIELAGWYENPEDKDGWSNHNTASFVSPYAHERNPNEDMAETIAYYILNPNKLLNVSRRKYSFVEQRIMHGSKYIAVIREDLQFEVLNLFPDYDYPGKIKRVDVVVEGDAHEDKAVVIEIELLNHPDFKDGAEKAITRIFSEVGTFTDLYLYPVGGNNHVLRGRLAISKYSKSGYWKINQITVEDTSGNKRMEGVVDFGFKLHVENPLEDLAPPAYVSDSLEIDVEEKLYKGQLAQCVTVTWEIEENTGIEDHAGVFIKFVSLDSNIYSIQKYGNAEDNSAKVNFCINNHFPPGRYTVAYLKMVDVALNTGVQYFQDNHPEHEEYTVVYINTTDPDYQPPEMDLDRIQIASEPTNPEAPDGQTKVEIIYYAKDDKSGVGSVSYYLQDPTGKTFHSYHYHENFRTFYFKGNPTEYKKYTARYTLPRGSTPGWWGLREMTLHDKGGNRKKYSFVEIVHFEVNSE